MRVGVGRAENSFIRASIGNDLALVLSVNRVQLRQTLDNQADSYFFASQRSKAVKNSGDFTKARELVKQKQDRRGVVLGAAFKEGGKGYAWFFGEREKARMMLCHSGG